MQTFKLDKPLSQTLEAAINKFNEGKEGRATFLPVGGGEFAPLLNIYDNLLDLFNWLSTAHATLELTHWIESYITDEDAGTRTDKAIREAFYTFKVLIEFLGKAEANLNALQQLKA